MFSFLKKEEVQKIKELEAEIARLKMNIFSNQENHRFVGVDFKEPIPSDYESRRNYVVTVASFYREIFENKINHLISGVRSQLGKLDSTLDDRGHKIVTYNPQEFNLILKGTENALWLIDDWCRQMLVEETNYNKPLSDEELNEVKKVIKT